MSTKIKYKQSETIEILRSKINFAPYNPRKKNQKLVDTLKRNFRKVGFLGGIAWNPTTGNLISGHKRLEALDLIQGYDGSEDKNYIVKVESKEMDETTEKEQNIFMNADDAQGEFEFKLLADILPEINYKNAGLSESTLELIELEVPDFNFGTTGDIIENMNEVAAPLKEKKHAESEARKEIRKQGEKPIQERKEEQKAQRQQMREDLQFESSVKSYVTLSFSSAENKLAFMNRFGFDATQEFIKGESFSDMIERIN